MHRIGGESMSGYTAERAVLGAEPLLELRDDNGRRVRIACHGAALVGFEVPRAGGPFDIAFGYRNESAIRARAGSHFAIMVPFAGRIGDARYPFNGCVYDLQRASRGATGASCTGSCATRTSRSRRWCRRFFGQRHARQFRDPPSPGLPVHDRSRPALHPGPQRPPPRKAIAPRPASSAGIRISGWPRPEWPRLSALDPALGAHFAVASR